MKVRTWGLVALIGVVGLMSTGCKYVWVRADAINRLRTQNAELQEAGADLKSKLEAQEALSIDLTRKSEAAVGEAQKAKADVQKRDETISVQRQMLDTMQQQVDALKKEKMAFEKRVAVLQDMVDAQKSVTATHTAKGFVMELPGDLAFSAGKADLKDEAKKVLDQVAGKLKNIEGEIQVAGHTDSTPVKYSPYGTNLNLSGARAMAVLLYLAEKGVDEKRMHFAGYGDHKPVMVKGKEDKDASRRVEIILLNPEVKLPAADVPGGGKVKPEKPGKVTPDTPALPTLKTPAPVTTPPTK